MLSSRHLQLDRKYYSPSALAKLGSEVLPPELVEQEDSSKLMSELTTAIYNSTVGDMNQIRTRAMLCHIYHHALHDRWFQARDLILMSHLQESIQHADVETQVNERVWGSVWGGISLTTCVCVCVCVLV